MPTEPIDILLSNIESTMANFNEEKSGAQAAEQREGLELIRRSVKAGTLEDIESYFIGRFNLQDPILQKKIDDAIKGVPTDPNGLLIRFGPGMAPLVAVELVKKETIEAYIAEKLGVDRPLAINIVKSKVAKYCKVYIDPVGIDAFISNHAKQKTQEDNSPTGTSKEKGLGATDTLAPK